MPSRQFLPGEIRFPNFPAILRVALLLMLLPPPPCAVGQTTNTTEELIRRSTFIFRGTVEKSAASTMPAVPASPSTAVVRVDQVIDGPGAPPDLTGKEITVQLLDPASVKRGSQAVFFTRGWLLGNSMAVIEVGKAPGQDSQRVTEQVRSIRQKMADEMLQEELATAEAVIVGKVASVRAAEIPHLGSEHDPDWYEARIFVESVLRGKVPDREVTLLFPHSEDVMWGDSPRFREGQQGIWMLHRNQARLPGIENQYTTLKALDFQPREQLSRVERLVKTSE
jgi:hypothetical protein